MNSCYKLLVFNCSGLEALLYNLCVLNSTQFQEPMYIVSASFLAEGMGSKAWGLFRQGQDKSCIYLPNLSPYQGTSKDLAVPQCPRAPRLRITAVDSYLCECKIWLSGTSELPAILFLTKDFFLLLLTLHSYSQLQIHFQAQQFFHAVFLIAWCSFLPLILCSWLRQVDDASVTPLQQWDGVEQVVGHRWQRKNKN